VAQGFGEFSSGNFEEISTAIDIAAGVVANANDMDLEHD
jgi:hypothetical protein